ncbi:MAG: hypothetical protein RLZZ301_1244 [Bacteroidota bacterium]|jgi:ComEC/Rec2-related protein
MPSFLSPVQLSVRWTFFFICCAFGIGIWLADTRTFTDVASYLHVLFMLLTLLFGSFRKLRSWLEPLVLASLFGLLGFWSVHEQYRRSDWSRFHFDNTPRMGVLHINELSKGPIYSHFYAVFYTRQGHQKLQLALSGLVKNDSLLKIGSRMLVRTKIEPITNSLFPGSFDHVHFYKIQGIYGSCFLDAQHYSLLDKPHQSSMQALYVNGRGFLSRQFERYLKGRAKAVAIALIVGDKSGIDAATKTAFSATGSMHILAVSGMHIGVLIQVLLWCLSWFSAMISRKQSLIICLLIVWYYAFLSGLSASVLRSVFMFSVLLIRQLQGRQLSDLNALFFSAFCLLLYNPMYLFDIGFELSYLAMAGIFLFYKPISKALNFQHAFLRYFWDGTAMALAATISTAPMTLYYFHQFPNYFLLANLALLFISTFVLALGMFFPVLAFIPLLATFLGFLLEKSIVLMLWIMDFFAKLPGAIASGFSPSFGSVLLLYLLFYLLFFAKRTHKLVSALLFVLLCFIFEHARYEQHQCAGYWKDAKGRLLILKSGPQALCFSAYSESKTNQMLQAWASIYPCAKQLIVRQRGRYRVHFQSKHKKSRVQFQIVLGKRVSLLKKVACSSFQSNR